MKRPVPIDKESAFDFTELFFSTTDQRGVIKFGNDLFIRVSKYPKETMIGAPHSVIRHPDMPRAVFKLLWQTIQSGRPIVAYVKNLAADGSYYWVLAFVFPLKDTYLSIRIKPSSRYFDLVLRLYPEVLKVEEEQGMDESLVFLATQLKDAGFANYTEFMLKSALSELRLVEERMEKADLKVDHRVEDIMGVSRLTAQELKSCSHHIEKFQEGNDTFVRVMGKLNDAFLNLKYIALNMTVSAGKHGEKVASLGVVAREFSDLSAEIQRHLSGLDKFIGELKELIIECGVRVSSLEVQMLMVVFFINESIQKMEQSEHAFEDMLSQQAQFNEIFTEYALALQEAMEPLKTRLRAVDGEMAAIRKFTTGLTVIRQVGAVESARENDVKQTFSHYLDEMLRFISLLQDSTTQIHAELGEMNRSGEVIVKCARNVAGRVEEVFQKAAQV